MGGGKGTLHKKEVIVNVIDLKLSTQGSDIIFYPKPYEIL